MKIIGGASSSKVNRSHIKANRFNFGNSNVFHIYTVGLLDWGRVNEEDSLITAWDRFLRENFISKIPEKFELIIHHYDPMFTYEGVPTTNNNEILQNKKAIQNLVDKENTMRRINSFYYLQPLNPAIIEGPHLVIDTCGLFEYSNKAGHIIYEVKEYKINSFRSGYLGWSIHNKNNKNKYIEFTFSQLLTFIEDSVSISQKGEVITYLDKIIYNNRFQDGVEPEDQIDSIYKRILSILISKIRDYHLRNKNICVFDTNIKPVLNQYFPELNNYNDHDNRKKIINLLNFILDNLNKTEEEIAKEIYELWLNNK